MEERGTVTDRCDVARDHAEERTRPGVNLRGVEDPKRRTRVDVTTKDLPSCSHQATPIFYIRSSRGPRFDPGLSDFIFYWREGEEAGARSAELEGRFESGFRRRLGVEVISLLFFFSFAIHSPHSSRSSTQLHAASQSQHPAWLTRSRKTDRIGVAIEMNAALLSTRASSALWASTSARSTTASAPTTPTTPISKMRLASRGARQTGISRFVCRAEDESKVRTLLCGRIDKQKRKTLGKKKKKRRAPLPSHRLLLFNSLTSSPFLFLFFSSSPNSSLLLFLRLLPPLLLSLAAPRSWETSSRVRERLLSPNQRPTTFSRATAGSGSAPRRPSPCRSSCSPPSPWARSRPGLTTAAPTRCCCRLRRRTGPPWWCPWRSSTGKWPRCRGRRR